jgi:hypothetical protein
MKQAQEQASREGRSLAVLNLNPFEPVYVIRDWDDRFAASHHLIARIDPPDASGDSGTTAGTTIAHHPNSGRPWLTRRGAGSLR